MKWVGHLQPVIKGLKMVVNLLMVAEPVLPLVAVVSLLLEVDPVLRSVFYKQTSELIPTIP